jgi:hypothetical protein
VTHPHSVKPARRVAALATAVLLGAGLSLLTAAPAQGAGVGYVRLAHLSPDSPEVDVYLDPTGPNKPNFASKVFGGVGYGVVSPYQILPVGTYLVSMRPKGAPASTPTTLTAIVNVAAGKAYTVAGVGKNVDLGLRVLNDDLSRPQSGKAKVRIIQASGIAPLLDISLPNGTPIATGVAFATTTPYQQVTPGTFGLQLKPAGSGTASTVNCTLDSGDVYSLIVLDGANGRLTAQLRVDARGGSNVPVDGVGTGGGGALRSSNPLAMIGIGVALMAAVALLSMRLVRLSRRRS